MSGWGKNDQTNRQTDTLKLYGLVPLPKVGNPGFFSFMLQVYSIPHAVDSCLVEAARLRRSGAEWDASFEEAGVEDTSPA